jgi:hypothetical protein
MPTLAGDDDDEDEDLLEGGIVRVITFTRKKCTHCDASRSTHERKMATVRRPVVNDSSIP